MKNPFVRLIQSRPGYRAESFIAGWYHTLRIRFRHPWLYLGLCSALDDPFDAVYTALLSLEAQAELAREQADGEDL